MKSFVLLLCCSCVVGVTAAQAQIPLNHPTQFYTNGEQVDGWTRNDAQQLASTFWLVKNPANSLSYRQQLVIAYDKYPNKLVYYDIVNERFIGRYDMVTGKYSLLAKENRKKRLEDIDESMFPPPGDKPRISEMFDPPTDGMPNDEQLMMPPATITFPRLNKSRWKGFYTDIGGNRRRKMTLSLRGENGTFQSPAAGVEGEFSDVQYETGEDALTIRGRWSAGRQTKGGFEFRLMMSDLNEFTGEYWLGSNRDRRFLWDGKRTSR